ncbi:MAG TPA: lamin tail domain-containing protein [Flavisolibacter sp.]
MMRLIQFFLCLAFTVIAHGQTAKRFDLLITEIMADPSPVVGLPNAEYIEIRNNSLSEINISGWKLSDAGTTANINHNYSIKPDSMVIICANAYVNALSVYGKTIGVSNFPSLDNDGDIISLRSNTGDYIHAVSYSPAWYHSIIKKEGGWSMEMIDPKNPCSGISNWMASKDAKGGTPGKLNSVHALNPDQVPPRLLRTYTLDSLHIIAVFDEPVDSSSACIVNNYSLQNMSIDSVNPLMPLLNSTRIRLLTPMQKSVVYQLAISNITDCANNTIGAFNKAPAGIPEDAGPQDLVINEILFNPRPGAFDFVEIYNRSDKIIDASQIWIAGRDQNGSMSSPKKISAAPHYIFPGDHFVITEDAISLQSGYLVKDPQHIFQLPALPSFPDDAGKVIIANEQGLVVDELHYSAKWHFALIDNADGVSLERIDPSGVTKAPDNWHSASSSSGFGTPTYKNSQFLAAGNVQATIEIQPRVFSPDNDGLDDWVLIHYHVEAPGYVGNVIIFDINGFPVTGLVKNDLMGLKGSWKWDGLDDKKNPLPQGNYIVFTEIFNLEGKKKAFKNVVTLGRRK